VNYWIGNYVGSKVFEQDRWFLKKKYLEQTQAFYDKHGGKAIVLARFVPIVRTFAPFVAGVGTMHYLKFITYNVLGAVMWVSLFLGAGYFFGNIPFVRDNFHYTVVAIILVSVLPMVYEVLKARREAKQEAEGASIQHMRESYEEEPVPAEVQE
jgi:membrane-associated protein